jgi:alpha-mannosidase
MDLGPNKFTYALLPHQGGWSEHTQMQAGELNQPLIAFVATKHHGGLLHRKSRFASLSTDKVAIKVLKKAEDTDEFIVRVYEWAGEDQKDVRLSFPMPVLSAAYSSRPRASVCCLLWPPGRLWPTGQAVPEVLRQ